MSALGFLEAAADEIIEMNRRPAVAASIISKMTVECNRREM